MSFLTHDLETIELGATAWRVIMNSNMTKLDPGRFSYGAYSARPSAGKADRYYFATDRLTIYFDNGVSWTVLALVLADSGDILGGYLSDKVQNSVVVDTGAHKIHLSGDQGSPGSNKVYGTNAGGTKGWYDSAGSSTPDFEHVTASGLDVGNITLSGVIDELNHVQTIPWSADISINWSVAKMARITVSGNTAFTFYGARDGDRLIVNFKNDAVGGHVLTFSGTRYGEDITQSGIVCSGANQSAYLGFIYHAVDLKYDVVSAIRAFV